jgi:hypothetical protein
MLIVAIMLRFSSSFACISQTYSPKNEYQFQNKSEHLMSAWLESSEEMEEEDSEGFEKEFLGGQPALTYRLHQVFAIQNSASSNARETTAFKGNSIYLLCRAWRL